MAHNKVRWIAAMLIAVVLGGTWWATRPDDRSEAAGQPEDGARRAAEERSANGLALVDVADEVGLDERQSLETLPFGQAMTGGAAVDDYDADGVMDIFLTSVGRPNQLYRGMTDGSFEEVAEQAGVAGGTADGSAAAVWADADGDGNVDLFVGGTGTTANTLYVNAGDGTFADETEQRGLSLPSAPVSSEVVSESGAFGAALTDWDHDGDLDLIVTHWNQAAFNIFHAKEHEGSVTICETAAAEPSDAFRAQLGANPSRARMYENDGSGHFQDVTAELGLDFSRVLGFTPTFADIDGDGWDDLLVTGDFCTSRGTETMRGDDSSTSPPTSASVRTKTAWGRSSRT